MTYSERLTITLPAALADIAANIAQGLDKDSGGRYSFQLSEDGQTISCATPCEPYFKAQAEYMMVHPEVLHATLVAEYSERWPDMQPPTLADCEAFCAAIIYDAAA